MAIRQIIQGLNRLQKYLVPSENGWKSPTPLMRISGRFFFSHSFSHFFRWNYIVLDGTKVLKRIFKSGTLLMQQTPL